MRKGAASLAVFSGLAAIVTADALAPADIPFQCATICGPVVELTTLCDVHQPLNKRRRTAQPDANDATLNLAAAPRIDRRLDLTKKTDRRRDANGVQKRSFSIIRPGPTSVPPVPVESEAEPTPSTTEAKETVIPSTSALPSPEPVETESTSAAPSQPVTTTVVIGDAGETLKTAPAEATSAGLQRGADQQATDDIAEEQCVCLNQSFDVAQVAALCASCIVQMGDLDNNANIIVSECAFPAQEYSANLDSVVDNVRVDAERPAAIQGEGALVDHSGASVRSTGIAVVAAFASLVVAMVTL